VSLTPGQISALRELGEVWPGRDVVIIGATALGFYYDMAWRKTADVDLVVAVEIDEFPGRLAERPGWTQHPDKEHEFQSPQGVRLDILPAGEGLLRKGTIVWGSGQVMSLVGIDLAFRHAEPHTVENFIVKVATPVVVTVLKMAAYLDRPQERLRDLEDIAHLLEAYVDDSSPRFWDEALKYGEYDLAPSYLLGLDVERIIEEPYRQLVEAFLSRVGDPDGIDHAQMLRRGPSRWSIEEQPLRRRLQALLAGLTAAQGAGR
jgi:predicted nucleotidyltransferase